MLERLDFLSTAADKKIDDYLGTRKFIMEQVPQSLDEKSLRDFLTRLVESNEQLKRRIEELEKNK